jgi:hypothetical protein
VPLDAPNVTGTLAVVFWAVPGPLDVVVDVLDAARGAGSSPGAAAVAPGV